MRLLLLSARPELATNRRLAEAAAELGHELELADGNVLCASLGARPGLVADGRDLLEPLPGAVLARIGNWRPESLLALLETAVAAGVATPNPPTAIRVGRDHWLSLRRLAAAGLPIPATVAGVDPSRLAAAAVEQLGLPVVVKQRRSRMGVGVVLCERRDLLEAVLDSLWRVGDEVVVQRYVACGATSLRLLVVGGSVVAAARLRAPAGEWRSNAARGGVAEGVRPDRAIRRLAVEAATALDLGVAGVDLLPGAETVVAEVNPTPGFLRLEQASGVDVAAAIVGHAAGLTRMVNE